MASAEAGNLLKMSAEFQRVEASGTEEQASTEDHQGKDSIHNASDNIADPELSPLSSSTYTSSTPSPSNLNSLGDYVPMCHIPIFDLTSYIHTPSDPEYSLTFQRKIRQKGILKYIMFGSESGPLLSLSLFFF